MYFTDLEMEFLDKGSTWICLIALVLIGLGTIGVGTVFMAALMYAGLI
jgi:hypothetical protein